MLQIVFFSFLFYHIKAMFLRTTQNLPPFDAPEKLSPELKNFFKRCTEDSVDDRASAEELLQVHNLTIKEANIFSAPIFGVCL